MLRQLLLRALAIGLFCGGIVYGQERPNFTGTWVRDVFPPPQAGELTTLTITDTPGLLTVERTAEGQTERVSFSFVGEWEPLINGTSGKDELSGPTVVQEAKASWHEGHLDTYIARQINGKTVTQNIRYTLDPSGSRMTVEENLQIHHGYESFGASPDSGGSKGNATKAVYIKRTR